MTKKREDNLIFLSLFYDRIKCHFLVMDRFIFTPRIYEAWKIQRDFIEEGKLMSNFFFSEESCGTLIQSH
ncbi:MAG: hypothetical protein AABX28_01965 [Nanoarchaeota archaeon]